MPWWAHPWKTSDVFPVEKMTTPGLNLQSHWHSLWVTPYLLWSLTYSHPVKLLCKRWRMLVSCSSALILNLGTLVFHMSRLNMCMRRILCPHLRTNPESFLLTGVIQELQVKLREHCFQVPSPQNFRPAPGTVCCAQFSGITHLILPLRR